MHVPPRLRPALLAAGLVTAGTLLTLSAVAQKPEDKPPGGTDIKAHGPSAGGKPLPDKAEVMKKAKAYLEARYDLSGKVDDQVKMSGGRKGVPVGPTARLAEGVSWDDLAKMTPDEMRKKKAFPYVPLWHPLQEVGGMVFPQNQIKEVEGLERVEIDFDLPEAYIPEFPPALFLTTRPDLGDVSKGKLITLQNFEELLNDVCTPFQLEGLKLLLAKTTAQRHNLTADRSTAKPVEGVSCFDCHANGHTTGAFHLTPDVRPQSERFRLDSTTLRGVFAQTRFGSKRAIRSLEDFSEVEENSAYFDGDTALAVRKGARRFTRREAEAMAHFQNIIDFPPAPKLDPKGQLIPDKASEAEKRGEKVFAKHCATCHSGPHFTDNLSHDLKV